VKTDTQWTDEGPRAEKSTLLGLLIEKFDGNCLPFISLERLILRENADLVQADGYGRAIGQLGLSSVPGTGASGCAA
jgi:hypothetical protein